MSLQARLTAKELDPGLRRDERIKLQKSGLEAEPFGPDSL
jgi:hypothetical protein